MPRGGARPGAGRPRKIVAAVHPASEAPAEVAKRPEVQGRAGPSIPAGSAPAAGPDLSPLDFLLSLVRDESVEERVRIQAASIAAPYCHAKPGEAGKKVIASDAAKKASEKFKPSAPPLKLVGRR